MGGNRNASTKNEYLQETVSGVRQLTEEEKIRQQCQAREDFAYWERMKTLKHQRELQEVNDKLQQASYALEQTSNKLQQTTNKLEQKDAQLAAALARIAELETANIK